MYLYLDHEILTEEERREFEKHLEVCRQCCKRYEFERALWLLIRQNGLGDAIPETLLHRIENVIAQF
ncbi:MAG: zf-HC2 domain-containing protein [Atribacterota bacterium]|nr:zf-HC2 domain-containing protein [Atribacterota bacterium]